MRKAVFIDKDGTLIKDVPYNTDPELVYLNPGAEKALTALKENEFLLILVTNQAGIAKGLFDEAMLFPVFEKINELLAHASRIDDFYYCPHHPQGSVPRFSILCLCRKPSPGMLFRAADKWGIDLGRSWMIGDILNDVETGNRAGCRSILLENGNETEWLPGAFRTPAYKVANLVEAASTILNADLLSREA